MNQTLLNLVLALATNELIHNLSEVLSTREKVKRLDAYSSGKKWKEMKFKINTRAKAYTLGVFGFFIFVLPLWGLFTWFDLSVNTSFVYIAIVLTLTYAITFFGFDRYHVEIERVTRRFMK